MKNVLTTSVGKKLMMAFTGLCFIGFLKIHLLGNLNIFAGGEAFDSYVEKLHSLGALIYAAEAFLLIFAAVHVVTGLVLFFKNLGARPDRYAVNKSGGGRTLASSTMPYTGVLILAFVVFHLFHFSGEAQGSVYERVKTAFDQVWYVALYVFAVAVTALHVRHGLWSAAQTLGANHPKYMPAVSVLSVVFALAVGAVFSLIPIYVAVS